jgi:tRNA-modifying protein YgfZ
MTRRSPLLDRDGAVEGAGIDAGVAAHYGSPYPEQRALAAGTAFVDLSHRGVIAVSGGDRRTFLHSLTSQDFESLEPGTETTALVLDPNGHVEFALYGADDGDVFRAHVEPGTSSALAAWLDSMRFLMRVEVRDESDALAPLLVPGGRVELVPRDALADRVDGRPAGMWAHEALRIERGEPRLGLDTDHKTIPNEVGWIGSAVHMSKGCYRGQETIARVHNLGRPPRRLVRLHLDGSVDRLPALGADVTTPDGRVVGFAGSSARHYELGPIGLALVKRSVPVDVPLLADGIAASQEVIVDPDIGLHVRARL